MKGKIHLFTALVLCSALLGACANNILFSGVDITKTGEGFYTITTNEKFARKNMDQEDFAMLRTAELARDKGYPYFAVLYGNTVVTAEMQMAFAGGVVNGVTWSAPIGEFPTGDMVQETVLHIQLLPEPPTDDGLIWYDAEQVISEMNLRMGSGSEDS